MRHLSIDLETRSGADIGKTGLYRYAQDDDFEILLFAYAFGDDPVQLIDLKCGGRIPKEVVDALYDPCVIKHAHNAAFEWYCLNEAGYTTYLDQWRCDMIHGLYCGYPGSLEGLCKALGVPEDKQKLSVGKSLIRHFCVPRKPTKNNPKKYNDPEDSPEKWELFKEYCKQDVVTEMENEKRLSAYPVSDSEWHLWHLDVWMNAVGVRVDTGIIAGALSINDRSTEDLMAEAKALTGVDNPNSNQQMMRWLNERLWEYYSNEPIDPDEVPKVTSLAKEHILEILGEWDIPDDVRKVLELKKMLGMTSIKKYTAMDVAKCMDDRVRGVSQFYGANRTGRYAGRLIQLQNLTKNHLEELDLARDVVKSKDYSLAKMIYGNVPDLLSQLVRTTFIPSEGNHFLVCDFSAIEARVIAWLAKEQWRLDAFAQGKDIYCESASQMFHVPVVKNGINGHLRQKGKVAELALGYAGTSGALIAMGALGMGLSEDELPGIVELWRQASPNIVKLWRDCDKAVQTVMTTARPVTVSCVTFALEGDIRYNQCFMTIRLPSGRKLYYPRPYMAPNRFGKEALHYSGMIQQTKKWGAIETHGGKLVENITQAIARDCLTEVLLRIEKRGWQTVFHVHDEVIVDAPKDAKIEELCDMMAEPISWAPGLLLKGAGFESMYYMKD